MNTLKTLILMALLTGIMVAVGGSFGGTSGATVMLLISLGMNLFSYWFSAPMVLRAYGAQEVTREEAPELYGMVEQLAANAHLPMPKLCIINSDVPNAFATGRNPSHAAVAVTTGIMRVLDYNELSGVLGHELTHVKNRDILISTIAAAMAGVISWIANIAQWAAIFGVGRSDDDEEGGGLLGSLVTIIIAPIAAFLIQMAISRSREYAADKGGGEICGNPEYLASALAKIDYYAKHAQPLPDATPATAHMFIVNPLEGVGSTIMNLFSTHPATEDRIARLHAQAQARR
ncbi:MAG: zinc metalloprotease HtpX [Selenomonadaceae bacterium]|jgi:heat shock protein HtpX|uniref:Protease HtpX homolog n=1 Tax=Selenomonas bovis TaxID=416586 RepID=A0A848BD74_9FIRM|nr:zinc metalloprotease HtpX [Selenomonas bovis]MBQ1621256.1 zinc metalloprotease HtpX [Selenomonas sp.]MCI6171057.1 zinc metalloprotease HtpX [Selenomonas bovis]MDY6272112.1 zinc metalloprotease HtpX [Selenomonadaceae bacterium]NMD99835.1 zinc metalloprotease HtpX [Selenomonas bovis]